MLGVWGVQLWNGNIITGLTVELYVAPFGPHIHADAIQP
jgi:hypothetical protein